jgi:DNA-binding response OmpR family regulator
MALIVLMEDDAGTRMMVASVLKRDGHVVLGAEDASKGLELVRQNSPELIISDVQMPGMNGFQMLAGLRQDPANATTPVILLTSLQERAHIRIGMTTGADDYITKPFRPDELRAAVSAQLNKRNMQASSMLWWVASTRRCASSWRAAWFEWTSSPSALATMTPWASSSRMRARPAPRETSGSADEHSAESNCIDRAMSYSNCLSPQNRDALHAAPAK